MSVESRLRRQAATPRIHSRAQIDKVKTGGCLEGYVIPYIANGPSHEQVLDVRVDLEFCQRDTVGLLMMKGFEQASEVWANTHS